MTIKTGNGGSLLIKLLGGCDVDRIPNPAFFLDTDPDLSLTKFTGSTVF